LSFGFIKEDEFCKFLDASSSLLLRSLFAPRQEQHHRIPRVWDKVNLQICETERTLCENDARVMQAWSEDGAALVRTWCEEGVFCPEIRLQ